MTGYKSALSPGSCTVEHCVEGSMKALGNTESTYGAWNHVILGEVIEGYSWLLPAFLAEYCTLILKKLKYRP